MACSQPVSLITLSQKAKSIGSFLYQGDTRSIRFYQMGNRHAGKNAPDPRVVAGRKSGERTRSIELSRSGEGASRSAETDGGPTRPKKGSGESDGPRKAKKGSGESDGPTKTRKGSGESDGPTKTKKGSGELEGPRTLLGFGAVDFDTKTMKRKSAESGSGETSGEPRSTIAPSDIQSMLFNQIQNPSREYEDRSQEISCLPTLTMLVYVACVVAIVYVLVNYSQKTRQLDLKIANLRVQ
ncbi:hypothetical protein Q1695_007697 [Nippostrongylus brasiliensis]|nr:hypothetical protein Q1695_007697 [Nippostrongylus brasiliensis]